MKLSDHLVLLHEEHPWIQNKNQARNVSLGENVGIRIKQFTLMNKFKKKVLRVSLFHTHLLEHTLFKLNSLFNTLLC